MAFIEFGENSTLSDDEKVLALVLSYLPTKLAMATSVVSEEFRDRWNQIFRLDLDDRGHGGNSEEFFEAVRNVWIFVQTKPLDKFRLVSRNRCDSRFVIGCIRLAISRKVRFLDLNALGVTPALKFQLPTRLYTCKSLVSLELEGPFYVNSPENIRLPRLKRLKLVEVQYKEGDSLTRLVSGCPILKSLHLVMRTKNDRKELDITISSRTLTYLYLFAPPSDSIKLRVPSLVEANVGVMRTWMGSQKISVVELVRTLRHVRLLTLSNLAFEGLENETDRWPLFRELTKLVVRAECSQWSTLFEILKRLPKLQVLRFEKDPCRCSVHVHWIKPKEVPGCFSSNLKQVSISGYQGFEDELAVVEYILKHGTVWKELQVKRVSRQSLV